MKKKIILDVDTGSDDAIAIMLAGLSEKIDLIGVCSVNGNRNIDITTENTLRVVDYLNLKVPVFRGCSLPLVVSLTPGRRPHVPYIGMEDSSEDVHGDYLPLPESKRPEEDKPAAIWLVETLMKAREKITLVFVGPLTNLAMAIRLDPRIINKIEKVVIMGGGYRVNNITPGAEFNFWIDPEAAKIVVDSGAPILIVPLDATHQACITWEEASQLIDSGASAATFCGKLVEYRIKGYMNFQPMEELESAPIHDALAVASLINPSVLTDVKRVHGDISICPGITDGMSLFDFDLRDKSNKPNVEVALGANRELFKKILFEVLQKEVDEESNS